MHENKKECFFSENTAQYFLLNFAYLTKIAILLKYNDVVTFLMMWSAQSNRPASGEKWEERVSRRLQRIADALNKDVNNGLEYGRLHRTLASLENEMLSRRDPGITQFSSITFIAGTSVVVSPDWHGELGIVLLAYACLLRRFCFFSNTTWKQL